MEEPTGRTDDDADLGHLVVQLARLLRKRRMRSLEPFGLSAHHARAFLIVGRYHERGHELRLSDLAARLRIAPRSATDVADALEAQQLVERAPCVGDRRATQLVLTEEGRALRRELDRTRADRSDEFFQALSTAEQETLRTLLAKVAEANHHD